MELAGVMELNAGLVHPGDKIFILTEKGEMEVVATEKRIWNLPRNTVFCSVNGVTRVDFRDEMIHKTCNKGHHFTIQKRFTYGRSLSNQCKECLRIRSQRAGEISKAELDRRKKEDADRILCMGIE